MKVRGIAIAFTVSTFAALALAVLYVRGGQPQVEGTLLALSLGGMGIGVILWAKELFGESEVTGERGPLCSPPADQEAFRASFQAGEAILGRRRFLTRLFAAAAGAFGVAALFPIRSLGPSPGSSLFTTGWKNGSRLVSEEGEPVRVGDLDVGGILTVFPDKAERTEDSAVVLLRVEPGRMRARQGREAWSPEGYVAYSKICTHVGCPVGLYREATHELLCPCHQSTFNVLDGARPVFGPATRSLPQLPLAVDDEGYLTARSDFTEPVGPAFWNRDRK